MPIEFGTRSPEDAERRKEAIICWIGEVAELYPGFTFATLEDRRFACLRGGDSIAHRILALGCTSLTKTERARLSELSGAIVELDADTCCIDIDSPPMLYESERDLMDAWIELHRSFGSALTEAEQEWIDIHE